MSVSPCLQGLITLTPTKKVVEGDINAWMETQNKENKRGSNHMPKLAKIRHSEVSRKMPLRQFPICQQIIRQLKVVGERGKHTLAAPKSGRSIELITPRINCRLSLQDDLQSSKLIAQPWSSRPGRSKYKLKEVHFKTHLTNKSLQIAQDFLTPNQKLLIQQIVKKRQMQYRWR